LRNSEERKCKTRFWWRHVTTSGSWRHVRHVTCDVRHVLRRRMAASLSAKGYLYSSTQHATIAIASCMICLILLHAVQYLSLLYSLLHNIFYILFNFVNTRCHCLEAFVVLNIYCQVIYSHFYTCWERIEMQHVCVTYFDCVDETIVIVHFLTSALYWLS